MTQDKIQSEPLRQPSWKLAAILIPWRTKNVFNQFSIPLKDENDITLIKMAWLGPEIQHLRSLWPLRQPSWKLVAILDFLRYENVLTWFGVLWNHENDTNFIKIALLEPEILDKWYSWLWQRPSWILAAILKKAGGCQVDTWWNWKCWAYVHSKYAKNCFVKNIAKCHVSMTWQQDYLSGHAWQFWVHYEIVSFFKVNSKNLYSRHHFHKVKVLPFGCGQSMIETWEGHISPNLLQVLYVTFIWHNIHSKQKHNFVQHMETYVALIRSS